MTEDSGRNISFLKVFVCFILAGGLICGIGLYVTGTDITDAGGVFTAAMGKLHLIPFDVEKKAFSAADVEVEETGESMTAGITEEAVSAQSQTVAEKMNQTQQTAYTVTTELNLRSEPSAEQGETTIITVMGNGAQCVGTGNYSEDGKWAEVVYESTEGSVSGWANLHYLDKVERAINIQPVEDREVRYDQPSEDRETTVSGGQSMLQEAQDFWNSDSGQAMLQEAQDFWNSDSGQEMLQEAQDFWNSDSGQEMLQEAQDFWNSDSGQEMLQEAQDFWNSDSGQAMLQEAMNNLK